MTPSEHRNFDQTGDADGPSSEVDSLLSALGRGDAGASEALFPHVYAELRALAGSLFRGNGAAQTLQPTAVVHEAYLKLLGAEAPAWSGREHFFALAARAMRQVLIDHARSKGTEKRGGAWERVSLGGVGQSDTDGGPGDEARLVDLEAALTKLGRASERQVRVVELRYFGGMSVPETARVLGVSERTVKSEWRFARAWLRAELSDG